MTSNGTALPAFALHQHVEIEGFQPMHQDEQHDKFLFIWSRSKRVMAPYAAAQFGNKRQARCAGQVTYTLHRPPISLLIPIEIHAHPVNFRGLLQPRNVKRRMKTKSDIMKNGYIPHTAFA